MKKFVLKSYKIKKQTIAREKIITDNHGAYVWAKMYDDPKIKTVPTGQSGNFRYSPVFLDCIVETMVKLTGYRKKDYVIAERQTGVEHIPKETVWHHAWEEKNGEYRMQLVNFEEHKKTCPHAGGCKLWLIKTKKKRRYASYTQSANQERYGEYFDISLFSPIEKSQAGIYLKGYVGTRSLSTIKKKKLELCGVDMYGNLLFKNRENTYAWDHETDEFILIKK